MVRDDNDVGTPELRRRQGEDMGCHSGAQREADAEKGIEAAESTEVHVVAEAASNKAVRGVTFVSEDPESLDMEGAVTSSGVLEPNVVIRPQIRVQW